MPPKGHSRIQNPQSAKRNDANSLVTIFEQAETGGEE